MTEFLEVTDHNYVLEPENPRLDGNLDYIKILKIIITNWEGNFKLLQDKKPKDIKADH